ncbi:Retinoblastoma-binding protein 5/Swd1 [Gracilaria domingensis]|nr:Retinoblastoma-binding protein 5/Swd1 [Gracilaria domingensis]
MNRALLNPFEAADLPRGIEEVLEQESGTCMRFNRHGNILAVGSRTGQVILWDFDTLSIACVLGDTNVRYPAVTSLSFPAPRNGSMVLAAHANGVVRLYDTLSRSIASEITFRIPIIQVVSHPKVCDIAVVVPKNSHPLILHLRRGVYEAKNEQFEAVQDPEKLIYFKAAMLQGEVLGTSVPHNMPKRPPNAFGNHKMSTVPNKEDHIACSVLCTPHEYEKGVSVESSGTKRKSPFYVTFTRSGDSILRGGQTGLVRSFKLEKSSGQSLPTAKCVSAVAVPGKASIRSIQFSRKGNTVLINSQDRAMRLFFVEQVTSPQEEDLRRPPTMDQNSVFAELVNKTQCHSTCLSRDGDFVLGAMEGADHRIHVWRAADGFLDLTLEGPRDNIVQILWHPMRPVFTSLSASGTVYVWMKNFTENWSAFAAEFNELEANEEYVEAEDEFDLKDPEDEEKRIEQREREEAEDVNIDVCDKLGWFSSDSDEEDTYFYVPAVPEENSTMGYELMSDRIISEKIRQESQRLGVNPRNAARSEMDKGGDTIENGRKRRSELPNTSKTSKPKRSRSGVRRRGREFRNDRNGQKSTPSSMSKGNAMHETDSSSALEVVPAGDNAVIRITADTNSRDVDDADEREIVIVDGDEEEGTTRVTEEGDLLEEVILDQGAVMDDQDSDDEGAAG